MENQYINHEVFGELQKYIQFYDQFSGLVINFPTLGTSSFINIDTYVYSSMKSSLDSIRTLLSLGRISDSYTLLRKFYDMAIINIYTNLYLAENFGIDNFIVEKVSNWVKGKDKLPGDIRIMKNFIEKSEKVSTITKIINFDKRYSKLRDRCNDYTHYNYYYNVLYNDEQLALSGRIKQLDLFLMDLENIIIYHLSYIFYFNDHYMMSTDYIDNLDCGFTPEEGSQYYVAPFIQGMFTDLLKGNRMDLANEILKSTRMDLR